MEKTFLVVTSIANDKNPVLQTIAEGSAKNKVPFIVIGDKKSPNNFKLKGCEFYSIEEQDRLKFSLTKTLPYNHYARKNIGYLIAISKGADVIIETDDDNYPLSAFWYERSKIAKGHTISTGEWVNVYKYFTENNIWPRGFALEHIQDKLPNITKEELVECPIQQGLANDNPDVDAIYRLIGNLPIKFNHSNNIILGFNSYCPFNSQNTTWFKEAFPLLYLPSYCSFRMTDIWRSFVAQRIAWTCGWSILFHSPTVRQERNKHNLMKDFNDEVVGYQNNSIILKELANLKLKEGVEYIPDNLLTCYKKLIDLTLIPPEERNVLKNWLIDIDKTLT